MSIKRYYADKDNTITNAFKASLSSRGVSGNMGQSDILETFSIYAQANTSSSELSRILIQFGTSDIGTDRTNGVIPASGSVSFILRLYNAQQTQTTPKNFVLVASAVSQSWQEGNGLDMEDYSDEDESNWLYASDTDTPASASVTVRNNSAANIIRLTGSSANYLFTSVDNSTPPINYFHIGASTTACATNIATIINDSASADFSANAVNSIVYLTSSAEGGTGNSDSLSSSAASVFDITGSDGADNNGLSASFNGGSNFTSWTTEGGDYVTGTSANATEYTFEQSFDNGFEDLELDVSHLVEDWLSGELNDYGFGVHLSSTLESASTSYYTKKFFARGSQYFFKRPTLEARWNSSKKDHRDSFYLSSSLVPASDNLMNLYLYNIVRGQLTDIPAVGTGKIHVSIYSGSAVPTGSKIGLSLGGGTVTAGDTNTTGSHVETGIYSCSFAYTSSAITTIFDVWHSASTEYHTGSAITVKTFDSKDYNFDQTYVSKLTNLKTNYSTNETARFRLYSRKKDWSPTIYTVASADIEASIVDDAYYKLTRAKDGLTVVNYGTGSVNHTRLSYDTSGSYFDFDIGMLESNNAYEISFVYLINGAYVEQSETFRFNVV